MNQNSKAITILCSRLCMGENTKPLEPKEWSELAQQLLANRLEPADILDFSEDDFQKFFNYSPERAARMLELIGRSGSISFETSRYENMGIYIVTRADPLYPKKLKKHLGNSCPPLFYSAGDLRLLEGDFVGYVGSRSVNGDDTRFTIETVRKTAARGYGVVSGGAKGVDTAAEAEALRLGGSAAAFISDSMQRKIKSPETVRAIQEGRLLLLSAVKPDAGFNAGAAMMRNRYIYAQSCGTVVIKSDYNKGGTWNGAVDNLRHEFCNTFCWAHKGYDGNMALIKLGAIPIDEAWDGDVTVLKSPAAEQLSLFEN